MSCRKWNSVRVHFREQKHNVNGPLFIYHSYNESKVLEVCSILMMYHFCILDVIPSLVT